MSLVRVSRPATGARAEKKLINDAARIRTAVTINTMASLLIEGQNLATVDVDALIRQTTRTVVDGMRVRRA